MGKFARMKVKMRKLTGFYKTGGNQGKGKYKMPRLKPRDWNGVTLEEVKKDFYQEHPKVSVRDEALIKEYMDQNRISVKGNDCPRPVEAFDEFSFPDCIMDAIKAHNFVKPTPIQSQAIPVALSGRNMVGIADTGSGKTLAFILPAVIHILGNNHPRNIGEPEVVVLAPTRELAQQIHQVVVSLGPGINVTSECFYGGSLRSDQAVLTGKVIEICIATPGRLVDFLGEGIVKLHRCAFFVLDEADKMLDMGFAPQIKDVIGQSRPDRQMLMFSATWPPEIQELAESYLKNYIRVNIGSLAISANHNITQKLEFCELDEKPQRIVKIMKEVMKEEENKTLIFVNSKVDVDVLTLQFRMNGWGAMGLHGGKRQIERDEVFNDFKTGKLSLLIATDVAARGLDVDDIKYIVNYDYPHSSEDYVHRIGRTARCNRKGTAITFFTPKDRNKAKDLILVLEEAGQPVPPHLRVITRLPPPSKNEKKGKLPGSKVKRREIKRILKQNNVNCVPLGSETGGDRLRDVAEIIMDPILNEAAANPNTKKNKRKAQNKVEAFQSQSSSSKMTKTDLHSDSLRTNPLSNFTDDRFCDDFNNPQWAPSGNFQTYEENSRSAPTKYNSAANPLATVSVNMQNPDFGTKGHNFEASADVRRGNNVYSTDYRNTSMPVDSRNYETSMGSRGSGSFDGRREDNVYSMNYRNANMPVNTRNCETSVGPRSLGLAGKYDDDAYGRRENNEYSTDNRNTSMSINSRNYETPMGPIHIRPFANPGGTRMHTNPRNMEPSFSARNRGGLSSGQRGADWDGAPAWRGPSRSNCSTNRMDVNSYPDQNWPGRSRYNQY